jgi:hypothetical protein
MALTPKQLTAIDRHLRKENWLLNEELIAELTDHYAVGIDERLARGLDFDTAIGEIHRDFGGRKGLLELEEDKLKSRSRTINLELRKLITSYAQPPRLSLTILVFGFSYWITTQSFNSSEWLRWVYPVFFLIAPLPLLILFFRNGYYYVAGKKQSMQPVKEILYRNILGFNLLNILNFFCGNNIVQNINIYSVGWQTSITFAYLLTGTIILDFVLVQPYRNRVFA